MHEVLIHISDSLFAWLHQKAEALGKPIEEVVVEALEDEASRAPKDDLSEQERLARFIRESGLFAPPDKKLGPELQKLAHPVSAEERARLAKVLSRGKPLSEMIVEERG